MKNLVIALIRVYKRTLSPDHGWLRARYPFGYCPFYPSCSQYAIDSIQKHGLFLGLVKALRRVYICRPGRQPSVDPA